MVRLSSGGGDDGGGFDEGGPGLETSDTQDETEDDTGSLRTRRLRRDARSDPLDEPTEEQPPSAASPSPSPVGGRRNVNTQNGNIDVSDIDEPEPETEPDPEPTTDPSPPSRPPTRPTRTDNQQPPDPSDTETSDGEPIDRSNIEGGDTEPPEPSTPSPPTGEQVGPGPGEDGPRVSSGDPTSPTVEDIDGGSETTDDTGTVPDDPQNASTGGEAPPDLATPEDDVGEVAIDDRSQISTDIEESLENQVFNITGERQDLERGEDFVISEADGGFQGQLTGDFLFDLAGQQFEGQIEEQTGRDVTPGEEFSVRREDGAFVADLSGSFVASLSREAAREAGRDLTVPTGPTDADGLALESGGFEVALDDFERSAGEAVPHRGSIDVEAVEAFGERRAEVEADREAAAGRLSGAMAASSAAGSEGPTETLDETVEKGENLLASLGVTLPEFSRDVTPGPGAGTAQQTGTTRIELGDLISGPATLPTFGDRAVTPGPGVAPRERTGEQEILTGDIYGEPATEDFGDAFGGLELAVYGDREIVPGPRAGKRERVGTVTVDEALRRASENLSFEFETLPAGDRPITPGPGVAPRERVPVEEAPEQHQDLARGVEGALSTPAFVPGTAGLLVNIGDFGVAVGSALTPEFGDRDVTPGPGAGGRRRVEGPDFARAGNLVSGAGQTVGNVAAVGASRTIEDPVETGAFAAGTLLGSAVLFGGAAAVGSRTSLATRALIQPGEEAAGIAGYNLARPTLGASRAGRLFPGRGRFNREPLIFSEESAIRGARRARSRASDLLEGRLPDVDASLGQMSRNLETGFTELRTQARIEDTPPRPSVTDFGQPRALVEGPLAASGPRAIGRGELGEGEFVIRPRGTGETGLEADDPAGPIDTGDLEGRGDGGGSVGGGPLEFEVEYETDSGVVVERVKADRPRAGESDLTRDLQSELGGGRRLESSIGFGMDTVEGPTLDADPFAGSLAAPGDLLGDVAGADLAAPAELDIGRADLTQELGLGLDLELDQGAELDQEPFIDLGFEFDSRRRFEFAAEQEQEIELEPFMELEGRREAEAEVSGFPGRRTNRRRDDPEFIGERRLVERSLLNPLTGR